MAKKKAGKKKKAARPAAKSKAVKRKVAAKKKSPAKKKAAKKKPPAKKAVAQKSPAKTATKQKKSVAKKSASTGKSLGRPRISGDAKLDIVFQKDFSARNAFQFLGVTTLRELEALRADDILERLTRPTVETVQRIRKSLALLNRSLNGDRDFAQKFRAELEAK